MDLQTQHRLEKVEVEFKRTVSTLNGESKHSYSIQKREIRESEDGEMERWRHKSIDRYRDRERRRD